MTHTYIEQVKDILKQLKKNPANVRFADLCKVCEHYFGKARQSGSSHRIYKTPWQGDPRVNIQNSKGKAESALKGIRNIVAGIIKDMKKNGEEIPQPLANKNYSGKFMVRVPPEVHRSLAIQAAESGVNINRLVSSRLGH